MDREILEAILGSFSRIIKDMNEIKNTLLILDEKFERRERNLHKLILQSIGNITKLEQKEYRQGKNTKDYDNSSLFEIPKNETNAIKDLEGGGNNNFESNLIKHHSEKNQEREIIAENDYIRNKKINLLQDNDISTRIDNKIKEINNWNKSKVIPQELESKNDRTNLKSDILKNPIESSLSKNEIISKSLPYFDNKMKGSHSQYNQFNPHLGLQKEISLTQKSLNLDNLNSPVSLSKLTKSQRSLKRLVKESQIYYPDKLNENNNAEFFNLIEREVEETL